MQLVSICCPPFLLHATSCTAPSHDQFFRTQPELTQEIEHTFSSQVYPVKSLIQLISICGPPFLFHTRLRALHHHLINIFAQPETDIRLLTNDIKTHSPAKPLPVPVPVSSRVDQSGFLPSAALLYCSTRDFVHCTVTRSIFSHTTHNPN